MKTYKLLLKLFFLSWIILAQHYKDSKIETFCCYSSESEALLGVKLLKESGWFWAKATKTI